MDFVHQDSALMQAAGINAVRTYRPITDVAVLDALHDRGIYVIMTIFYDSAYGDTAASAASTACALRSHPAIVMWMVMNEPNIYYGGGTGFVAEAETVVSAIKAVDPSRPVSVCWGELPPWDVLAAVPSADVWATNVYRGASFHGLFWQWSQLSSKPLLMGEYGVDSFSSILNAPDEATHAREVLGLMAEIEAASAATHHDGVAIGGCYFEFADEWWKFTGRSHDGEVHVWPGGPYAHDSHSGWTAGGYADAAMHEEHFGLVDIFRSNGLTLSNSLSLEVARAHVACADVARAGVLCGPL